MKKNTAINICIVVAILAIGLFGSWYLSVRQENKEIVNTSLAIISSSGSTNFPGYTLQVNFDGSGLLRYTSMKQNQPLQKAKSFSRATFDAVNLRNTLNKVGDVSKIPFGHCMKSASFGSITRISYEGKTSGDISCIAENASSAEKTLGDQINQIQLDALK